jgi:hypothetical protein
MLHIHEKNANYIALEKWFAIVLTIGMGISQRKVKIRRVWVRKYA